MIITQVRIFHETQIDFFFTLKGNIQFIPPAMIMSTT